MRRPFLKRLRETLEATLTGAAFAEESEVETARQIVMDELVLSLAAGRPHVFTQPRALDTHRGSSER